MHQKDQANPSKQLLSALERIGARPGLKLWQQAVLLVIIPLLFEILFVGLLYQALAEAEEEANRALQARRVAEQATLISQMVLRTASMKYFAQRGFAPGIKKMVAASQEAIFQEFQILEELVKNDPKELAQAKKYEAEFRSGLEFMDQHERIGRPEERWSTEKVAEKLKAVGEEFFDNGKEFAGRYQRIVLASPEIERKQRLKLKILLLLGILGGVALSLGLVAAFILTTGRRLGVIMDNVERLRSHSPLNEPLKGSDELADLDRAFHNTEQVLSGATQLREQLIGIASHELRSPLTSVDATLKLMLDGTYGELPTLARERAIGAEQSLVRLVELVNDLLDAESIKSGALQLKPCHTELDGLVWHAIESVGALADMQNIELRYSQSNVVSFVDDKRVLQVLVNLLSNAIKFSPGGSAVQVSTIALDDAVEMRVQDNAPRLSEPQRQAIFERFTTGNTDNLSPLKGTGLGLAIAKAIVEWHGGTIGVMPAEPEGNVFWFRLPVRRAHLD